MKELKKQILELLYQKLSVYGFKKKQQRLLIRTVKENNVVQIIALGFAHRERHRIFISISVGVIYKNINNEAIKFGEANRLKYYNPMECIHIGYLMPQKDYHAWYFELNGDPQAIEDNIRDVASSSTVFHILKCYQMKIILSMRLIKLQPPTTKVVLSQ